MKTILINPPQNTKYPQPPLGLASLAAVLEQKGHQVEIIDANAFQLSERDIVKKVKGAASTTVFESGKLSKEEFQAWNAKAFKEFYFRDYYILQTVIGMRSLGI